MHNAMKQSLEVKITREKHFNIHFNSYEETAVIRTRKTRTEIFLPPKYIRFL